MLISLFWLELFCDFKNQVILLKNVFNLTCSRLLFGASLVVQLVKDVPASAGDPVSILGSGRSPGERNGNPFQYSCLENPMDREVWWATVHGVTRVRHDLVTKPQPQITILSKLKQILL